MFYCRCCRQTVPYVSRFGKYSVLWKRSSHVKSCRSSRQHPEPGPPLRKPAAHRPNYWLQIVWTMGFLKWKRQFKTLKLAAQETPDWEETSRILCSRGWSAVVFSALRKAGRGGGYEELRRARTRLISLVRLTFLFRKCLNLPTKSGKKSTIRIPFPYIHQRKSRAAFSYPFTHPHQRWVRHMTAFSSLRQHISWTDVLCLTCDLHCDHTQEIFSWHNTATV